MSIKYTTNHPSVSLFSSLMALAFVFALGCFAETAAQWTTSGTNINNTNTGNVGVGTTTPGVKLHVVGGIYSSQVIESANTSGFRLVVTGPGDSRATWSYDGGSTTTRLTSATNVRTSFGSNGINDRMFLDLAGNLGIGTTTPGHRLEVVGATNWIARFKKTDNSNGGIVIDTVTGFKPNVALAVNGANKWHLLNNASSSDSLQFWEATGGFARFTLTQAGNVGIGTTSPGAGFRLDVQGGSINSSGGLCIAGDCKTAWSQVGGSQWTTSGTTINYATGNVGVGTASPTEKLHVTGNVKITGNIDVSGNIKAKYQDVAEWVESSQQLVAATVVILDSSKSNQVIASTQSYDARVAGVVSLQPGLALGEEGEGRVLVATTGRVKVKVDATSGPIQIGDLLVTSDREGFAMKSVPVEIGGVRIHRPGTLIGKALEPLAGGTGEILVLLSMQ